MCLLTVGKHRLLFSNSNEKQCQYLSANRLWTCIFPFFLSLLPWILSSAHTTMRLRQLSVSVNERLTILGKRHPTPTNPLNLNIVSFHGEKAANGSLDFQRIVTCRDRPASTGLVTSRQFDPLSCKFDARNATASQ